MDMCKHADMTHTLEYYRNITYNIFIYYTRTHRSSAHYDCYYVYPRSSIAD